ncbi:MAG: ADP-heptose--LPS heptosyltransferase [Phycisphaerae bacterium]|nr:MAG: ADP-heptose--LPS heptosyltransferase [Phycisphaerae bacterium]
MKPVHSSSQVDPTRIVVFMPTWVGDVVMATPGLRALRNRFADAHITLLTRPNTVAVLEPGTWMDEIITWPKVESRVAKWNEPFVVGRQLREKGFDWAVLLSNSFRSALTARMARINRRIGYDRDGRGWLLTDRIPPRRVGKKFEMISTVDYFNELIAALDCPMPTQQMELSVDPGDVEAVESRLREWGIAESRPLVVINPGASFGPSKLWPPERYGEVAEKLVRDKGASVVVTFGPGERDLALKICDTMTSKAYLVDDPPGTIGQLKALIKRCDILLNNDTGPRHFAKAFGRNVLTVFGSTHVEWTQTDYAKERSVRIPVDCGPCQKKVCPEGHHKCMTGVTSEMVYDAAVELLDHRDPSS